MSARSDDSATLSSVFRSHSSPPRHRHFLALALIASTWPCAAHAAPSGEELLVHARQHEAEAEFALAAADYERVALENPTVAGAAQGLARAVMLRLGTGSREAAAADVALFRSTFGKAEPARAASLLVTLASDLADHRDFESCRKLLFGEMAALAAEAAPHTTMLAHLTLGRCHAGLGEGKEARRERGAGLTLSESLPRKPLGKAEESAIGREIAGAALSLAHEEGAKADAMPPPAYAGRSTREAVLKHLNTAVADWLRQRRAAVDLAARAYERVFGLGPLAPDAAKIEARARTALLSARIVTDLRAAPIPLEWKGNGPLPGAGDLSREELRGHYYAAIDEASEPQKIAAKRGFAGCLALSVELRRYDASTQRCQQWLSKHDAAEHPSPELSLLTLGHPPAQKPSAP